MAAAGHLVGPYRLLAKLGRGAMGEVWRARDERLDRFVAIKMLPRDDAHDPVRRARMLREAKAAAGVPHANVVTLFDVISENGEDFLVMELVEGRTLRELLQAGPIPTDDALAYIAGVADALTVAHERGILHRDIKPSNVMVSNDGGVKVLDFGLAKLRQSNAPAGATASDDTPAHTGDIAALDATLPSPSLPAGDAGDMTRAGDLFGTPMYMAPEQITGAAPDARSEVFSIGVLAYELLAHRRPFEATTMPELFERIVHAEPPPLTTVDAELRGIVDCALAKDPRNRYQSVGAMAEALANARRTRLAKAAAPGSASRAWRLTAVAGAIAVLGVGIATVLGRSDTEPGPPVVEPTATRPGDEYIARALEEYDLFYTDKALASLRAAIKVDPDHPLPYAYLILFDATSAVAAPRGQPGTEGASAGHARNARERALVNAALALASDGPKAARDALLAANATPDRELAFWAAELAFRARDYPTAADGFHALLESDATAFRGRIFDHYSAVLLYYGRTHEALEVGRAYADAFPGEADALGVYATTLAAAGRFDEALQYATEALTLNEGEDTLAGLAKVHALRGEIAAARRLYQRSADRAGPARRTLRRAALGVLSIVDGDIAAARAAVEPCLRGGSDAGVPERGACLWVAGVVFPERRGEAIEDLSSLAAAGTSIRPAYGFPAELARLLEVIEIYDTGGCLTARALPPADQQALDRRRALLDEHTGDFFAAYHVPYFNIYAACQRLDAAPMEQLAESYSANGLLLLSLAEADVRRRQQLDALRLAWPTVDSQGVAARRAAVLTAAYKLQ